MLILMILAKVVMNLARALVMLVGELLAVSLVFKVDHLNR
uniref:Uncharacterized protein n=1 Tax=Kalanchoe fedtschenkoi TaxID=63787 RepID=A0A7N0TNB2_KALFE